MEPLTSHEKEVALAAIALRLEQAQKIRDREEIKEWRKLYREVCDAPLL